ncbi:MAG: cyclase family protein [Planctomycetes bacterium]|nr:cyclase family protein [Planctomycetota bacterium]
MADQIIDISPRISSRLAVFPGDVPMAREVLFDMKRGDGITLSAIRSTVHLGAHADAPSHYGRDGRTMEQQPLDLYWGECEVVKGKPGARSAANRIGRSHLAVNEAWVPKLPRLLIATGSYPDGDKWTADFCGLEPDLVDWLADHGVKLVGVDTPSVDCADSKDLPAHKRFYARDVAIIEGLVLRDVPPGRYELCAMPLALEGFDGSPVRAALKKLN